MALVLKSCLKFYSHYERIGEGELFVCCEDVHSLELTCGRGGFHPAQDAYVFGDL